MLTNSPPWPGHTTLRRGVAHGVSSGGVSPEGAFLCGAGYFMVYTALQLTILIPVIFMVLGVLRVHRIVSSDLEFGLGTLCLSVYARVRVHACMRSCMCACVLFGWVGRYVGG